MHYELKWDTNTPTRFNQQQLFLHHHVTVHVQKRTLKTDNLSELNQLCKKLEKKTPYVLTKFYFKKDLLVIEFWGIEPLSSSLTLQEASSAWHRMQFACFKTFPIPQTGWEVRVTSSIGTMPKFLDMIDKKSLPQKLENWLLRQQMEYDSSPIYQPKGW